MLHALVLLTLVATTYTVSADAPRPNIVWVLADDLGVGEVGLFPSASVHGRIQTPHIDVSRSLAAQPVVGAPRIPCAGAIVQAPSCWSSVTLRWQRAGPGQGGLAVLAGVRGLHGVRPKPHDVFHGTAQRAICQARAGRHFVVSGPKRDDGGFVAPEVRPSR